MDRIGIRVLRDPYSAKPYVLFYTTKRVGGGVQNFEAIKLMKFAASAKRFNPPLEGRSKNATHFSGRGIAAADPSPKFVPRFARNKLSTFPQGGG